MADYVPFTGGYVPLTGGYALPTGYHLPRSVAPDSQPVKRGGKVATATFVVEGVSFG